MILITTTKDTLVLRGNVTATLDDLTTISCRYEAWYDSFERRWEVTLLNAKGNPLENCGQAHEHARGSILCSLTLEKEYQIDYRNDKWYVECGGKLYTSGHTTPDEAIQDVVRRSVTAQRELSSILSHL